MADNRQDKINNASYLYSTLITVYLLVVLIMRLTGWGYDMGIIQNLILSQSMILVPTLVFIIMTRCSIRDTLRIRATHWAAIFIVPVFVVALEPVMSLINSISLLWVESGTTELSTELVARYPLWVSTLLMAATPAIVEELAYRGFILGNYRYGGRLAAIIISGIMFGVMHMNFNQMAYAMILGILLGMLAEATGSILTTIYAHFCFNELSVLINYVVWKSPVLSKSMETSLTQGVGRDQLKATILVMCPVAFMGLCVALAILFALSVINGRRDYVMSMFIPKTNVQANGEKVRMITVPLVVTLVVCIVVMSIFEFVL